MLCLVKFDLSNLSWLHSYESAVTARTHSNSLKYQCWQSCHDFTSQISWKTIQVIGMVTPAELKEEQILCIQANRMDLHHVVNLLFLEIEVQESFPSNCSRTLTPARSWFWIRTFFLLKIASWWDLLQVLGHCQHIESLEFFPSWAFIYS